MIRSPKLLFRVSCASFGGLITTASKFRRALGEVVRADSEPVISVDPVPILPSGHDLMEGEYCELAPTLHANSVSLRPRHLARAFMLR